MGRAVAGIGELALAEREASAADAPRQAFAQCLEFRDTFIDARLPCCRDSRPVGFIRSAITGQLREFGRNLIER